MTYPRPQSWPVVNPIRTLSFWPQVTIISTQVGQFSGPQAYLFPMFHYLSPLPSVLCTKMEQNLGKIRISGKNSLNEHQTLKISMSIYFLCQPHCLFHKGLETLKYVIFVVVRMSKKLVQDKLPNGYINFKIQMESGILDPINMLCN